MIEHTENRDLITNPSYKNIMRLSWPTMISYIALLTVSIVDLYFVGDLGRSAIAAVSIGGTVWWLLMNFLDGLRQATTILVAGFVGEGQDKKSGLVLNLSLLIAGIISVVLFFSADALSDFLHGIMTSDPAVVLLGRSYLPILLKGSFATLMFFSIEGFFRGLGNTFLPMLISGVVCVVNIFFNWTIVAGHMGFTKMGVKGAAMSTVCAECIGLLIGVCSILTDKSARKVISKQFARGSAMFEFLKISLEVGFFALSISAARCIFTAFIGRADTLLLAAHQIANQVFSILFLPSLAFMISASIIASALVSSNQLDLLTTAVRRILVICMLTMLVFGGLIWFYAESLALAFSPTDLAVAKIASKAIKLVVIDQVICAFSLVLRGVLAGVGMAGYTMVVAFFSSVVIFLPLAWLVIFQFKLGLLGGYIAMIFWTLLSTALFSYRYFWTVANSERFSAFLKKTQGEPGGVEQDFAGMTGVCNPAEVAENSEIGILSEDEESSEADQREE